MTAATATLATAAAAKAAATATPTTVGIVLKGSGVDWGGQLAALAISFWINAMGELDELKDEGELQLFWPEVGQWVAGNCNNTLSGEHRGVLKQGRNKAVI